MKTRQKQLIISVTGTDRKRKEIERAVRELLLGYRNFKGVYEIKVHEENIVTVKR